MASSEGTAIEEVETFLDRYREFEASQATQRFDEFEARFRSIASTLPTLEEDDREARRHTSERFNLFLLLGIADKEVKTHSALLADLLNPRGTHDQGALYLQGFLALVARKAGLEISREEIAASATSGWVVETERVTGYGNLDLVLERREPPLLIVIENKIYAGDQNEQLSRYWKWMEQRGDEDTRRILVYLTIEGGESPSAEDAPYLCLSYRNDIRSWLESSRAGTSSPRMLETIDQYLQVLSYL